MPKANNGKKFENAIKNSTTKQGILFERFQDSNKFNQGNNDKIRFTLNSPCDCFMFDGYCLYYIELKSTIGTSISFNQPCTEKGGTPMIKAHQINSLLERQKYDNVFAGLLLDFADRVNSKGEVIEGGTYYIPIDVFVGWTKCVPKKSINKMDCEAIGIKVERKLKRVNYDYDIKKLLNDIVSNTI